MKALRWYAVGCIVVLCLPVVAGGAEARGWVAPAAELWADISEKTDKIQKQSACNKQFAKGKVDGYSNGFLVGSREANGIFRARGSDCYERGYRIGYDQGYRDGEARFKAGNNPLAGCRSVPVPEDRKVTVTYELRCEAPAFPRLR